MAKHFDTLHMRNILYLQDVITKIEACISALDDAETCQTFLSSRQHDGNAERQRLGNLNQLLENVGVKASVRNRVLMKKPLIRSESRIFLELDDEADIEASVLLCFNLSLIMLWDFSALCL
ncbi:hypothetical protein BDW59DRAFT_164549 [Aspergillus cavernicola]|uniref:DUF6594 domain-containing protein n=1 Tax=Aspergillus cavernicola TaxID=176166 RepID=A0ABR4HZC6_9EURO